MYSLRGSGTARHDAMNNLPPLFFRFVVSHVVDRRFIENEATIGCLVMRIFLFPSLTRMLRCVNHVDDVLHSNLGYPTVHLDTLYDSSMLLVKILVVHL